MRTATEVAVLIELGPLTVSRLAPRLAPRLPGGANPALAGALAEVRAMLVKYCGADADRIQDDLPV